MGALKKPAIITCSHGLASSNHVYEVWQAFKVIKGLALGFNKVLAAYNLAPKVGHEIGKR